MKTNLSHSEAIIIQVTVKYQKSSLFLICFKKSVIIINQFFLKNTPKTNISLFKTTIFLYRKTLKNCLEKVLIFKMIKKKKKKM